MASRSCRLRASALAYSDCIRINFIRRTSCLLSSSDYQAAQINEAQAQARHHQIPVRQSVEAAASRRASSAGSAPETTGAATTRAAPKIRASNRKSPFAYSRSTQLQIPRCLRSYSSFPTRTADKARECHSRRTPVSQLAIQQQ